MTSCFLPLYIDSIESVSLPHTIHLGLQETVTFFGSYCMQQTLEEHWKVKSVTCHGCKKNPKIKETELEESMYNSKSI